MINKKNILLTIILILFLLNVKIVVSSTITATSLFINKVFISIFSFIILSDILIYFNYHLFLGKVFGNFFKKVFNISLEGISDFILSMLTSHPSNAIYIKNSLDNNNINVSEAQRIYTYTFFPSIMFVLGTVGNNLFGDIKIGIFLLLNNYLCNFFIGLFLRKNNSKINDNFFIKRNNINFFNALKEAIFKSINTCFLILGNITIFIIIINIINNYLNFPPLIKGIISGLFEMTSGIYEISNLNINLNIKLFIISFLLNFSGLAIFCQGASVISPYNFNYKKILVLKLIFSLISSCIFLLF